MRCIAVFLWSLLFVVVVCSCLLFGVFCCVLFLLLMLRWGVAMVSLGCCRLQFLGCCVLCVFVVRCCLCLFMVVAIRRCLCVLKFACRG